MKRGGIASATILFLGQLIKMKRQEKEKKKGPCPHTPKSIHPFFLSQIEN